VVVVQAYIILSEVANRDKWAKSVCPRTPQM